MRRTNKTGNPSKKSKASNADPTQYFHIIDDTKQNNSECRVTYSQFMANGKPVKTKEDRYRDEPICCVRITLKNYTDNKKVMKEILERSDYVIRTYLKKNYLSINDNDSLLDTTKTNISYYNSKKCQLPPTTSSIMTTTPTSKTSKISNSSIYYNDGNKDAMVGIKNIQKSKYSNLFIGTLTSHEAETLTKDQNTFRIYCRILDEKCIGTNKSGWLQIYIVYKNLTDNYIHIPVMNVINDSGEEGLTFYNFNNMQKVFKNYDALLDFLKEIINDRPSILVAKYGKIQDKGCIPKVNKNAANLKTNEPTFYNYYIGVKNQNEAEGYLRGPLDFKMYHRLLDSQTCLTCSDISPQLSIVYQCHSGQVIHLPIAVREKNNHNEYAIYHFDGVSPIFDNLNCITSFIFKSILDFKRHSRMRIYNAREKQ
uniref:SH2 domain-containing protein n=2 Tax=Strongyloides papillosus TaxID=174720 RepID=A0A0N5B5U9_STREA